MMIRSWRIAALLIASHLVGPVAIAGDVLVFAAASTALALEEAIHRYGEISPDRVRAAYASSGALARQLDNGAPADLYLSANTKWLEWVKKKGLLVTGTRLKLLRNRLVLVQHGSVISTFIERDLKGWLNQIQDNRLAIADPAHAPAGEYAKQALLSLGLWKNLSNRTVRAPNVRAALLLVERQEAPYGIIYQTDARASKAVRILATFPEHSHKPIVYGLAMIRNRDNPASRHFYNYLKSPAGTKIFRHFGFLAP